MDGKRLWNNNNNNNKKKKKKKKKKKNKKRRTEIDLLQNCKPVKIVVTSQRSRFFTVKFFAFLWTLLTAK